MREVFVSTKSLEIETTGNIVELLANRETGLWGGKLGMVDELHSGNEKFCCFQSNI